MKQFDIQLSVNGNLEWITEIYQDDINSAIQSAIQLVGKAQYVGHHEYIVQNGAWLEGV